MEGIPMNKPQICAAIIVILLSVVTASLALVQLAPTSLENSPERRGEVGCSIVERKLLPEGIKEPVFWHIDRFDSLVGARRAVGPTSVAFDAAGTSWLMTIESRTSDHHGGNHVAEVGPLPLPQAKRYSLQVLSSALTPGMYSTVHHHSGIEAVYVLEGDGCYETPTRAHRLRKGETLVLPGGTLMRAVMAGSTLRYVFAVIIHDAEQPPTMQMDPQAAPKLAACE
jgi:quercetin dioxygenase-like cupin family protein